MSVLGSLNIALLIGLYRWVNRRTPNRLEKLQLLLCATYTLGCASRCFVLRSDVARFAMFDSWVSTVLVGRTIATIAELAFVAQWVVLLVYLARTYERPVLKRFALPILPMIMLAQCCAWYGVLTTNYIGQTLEESLWTLSALLFGVGLWLCRKEGTTMLQRWVRYGVVGCIAYLLFMTLIDVPNYYRLWQAKEQAGATYLTLSEGFRDIQNMIITGAWSAWRYPMVWQSLYFSLAVWASMTLVMIPIRLRQESASSS